MYLLGPDVMDSTTIKEPFQKISLSQTPNIKGVKVGIPKEYYCKEMSSEVTSTWTYMADKMENAGAIVKQVSVKVYFILYIFT